MNEGSGLEGVHAIDAPFATRCLIPHRVPLHRFPSLVVQGIVHLTLLRQYTWQLMATGAAGAGHRKFFFYGMPAGSVRASSVKIITNHHTSSHHHP